MSSEKVLRFDVNTPLSSLDPHTNLPGSANIFPLLYSYLFIPDAGGQLQSDLAVRWTYDPKLRCWTITLKSDARFHDRQPVTSRDVKHSLDKGLGVFTPALSKTIGRVEVLSDHVLRIHLIKEDTEILKKIWDMEIVPYPRQATNDDKLPIGSGPFKFSHRQGTSEVVIEANADYYGGRPYLDRIVFYHQPDRELAWTRLLADATDIVQEISPHNYEIMQQYHDRFYFDRYTLRFYTILLYNTLDPLFSSAQVRWALTLGIDRDHIVRHILRGYGKVATGAMGLDSPYAAPEVVPAPYDPQKALALLNSSGWAPDAKGRLHKNGRPFDFTLLVYRENQIEKNVARFIQLSLNDLGIKVRLKAIGFNELKKRHHKNTAFQAVLTEFSGAYRRPELLLKQWSSKRRGKSDAGAFKHPEVTRLLQEASSGKEIVKQRLLLQKVDALIADLQPGTFLFHKTALDAMSRRYHLPHRFTLTLEGIHRLKYASPTPD